MTRFPNVACLAVALFAGLPAALAQDDNRLSQITALFDDAEPAFRAIATCRMSNDDLLPPKIKKSIETSLNAAGLKDVEVQALLSMINNFKPFLSDDRPVAEAILFCGSVARGNKASLDKVFSFAKRLQETIAVPPGRDDTQVLRTMKEISSKLNEANVCVVVETGPLPKRKPFTPDSDYGKELARFDISQPVRTYIDTLFARETDFSAYKDIGALRAHCSARQLEFRKIYDATKKPPPPLIKKLKDL